MKKKHSRGSPAEAPAGNRSKGARAERAAAWLYRLRGYRVLATNAWAAGYEVDLVVRRGRLLVFCEVKSKGGADLGDPAEMVTPEKQRRILAAAEAWLAANPDHADCELRFDVVAARGRRPERIRTAF